MEQRNSIGKTLWNIGSPFLLYVILSMSLQDALALCLTPWLDEAEYLTWSLAAVNALEIPIFYRMYRTRQGSRSREIPERSWIPAVLGAVFLGRGSNLLLGLTPLPTLFPGYQSATDSLYGGGLPALLAASVVTAPVLEELLVRGILYGELKKALQNRYAAMVCASLLFGILHGNLVQGIFAFLTGLYLNWICEAEDSLLPSILAHSALNASTIWLSQAEPEWLSQFLSWTPGYLLLTAICLLAGFVCWKKIRIMK